MVAIGLGGLSGPILVFLGVALGHWLSRRAAKELEARSRREQLLRTLQWAADLAVDSDQAKAALGVEMLLALANSRLSNPMTDALVDAALRAVVGSVVDEIEQNPDAEIVYGPDEDLDD